QRVLHWHRRQRIGRGDGDFARNRDVLRCLNRERRRHGGDRKREEEECAFHLVPVARKGALHRYRRRIPRGRRRTSRPDRRPTGVRGKPRWDRRGGSPNRSSRGADPAAHRTLITSRAARKVRAAPPATTVEPGGPSPRPAPGKVWKCMVGGELGESDNKVLDAFGCRAYTGIRCPGERFEARSAGSAGRTLAVECSGGVRPRRAGREVAGLDRALPEGAT